jgi:hypothetical protein
VDLYITAAVVFMVILPALALAYFQPRFVVDLLIWGGLLMVLSSPFAGMKIVELYAEMMPSSLGASGMADLNKIGKASTILFANVATAMLSFAGCICMFWGLMFKWAASGSTATASIVEQEARLPPAGQMGQYSFDQRCIEGAPPPRRADAEPIKKPIKIALTAEEQAEKERKAGIRAGILLLGFLGSLLLLWVSL